MPYSFNRYDKILSKVHQTLNILVYAPLRLSYALAHASYRIASLPALLHLAYAVIISANNEWRFFMNKEQMQGKADQLKGELKKNMG
jgi:hypothetical protein